MSWDITGGWSFAVAPDTPPADASAVWRPDLLPVTVLLAPAAPPLGAPIRVTEISETRLEVDGFAFGKRHIVLRDLQGDHRLCVLANAAADAPVAAVIPLDDPSPYRLEATLRLHRRLRRQAAGPLPQGWRLTTQQSRRLTLALQAFDARRAGLTNREIASALLDPAAATLSASTWKPSALRAQTKRLLAEGHALVAGGYLGLLRGGAL